MSNGLFINDMKLTWIGTSSKGLFHNSSRRGTREAEHILHK
jgi:hypothetical protein